MAALEVGSICLGHIHVSRFRKKLQQEINGSKLTGSVNPIFSLIVRA